jgi:hypothetical protein
VRAHPARKVNFCVLSREKRDFCKKIQAVSQKSGDKKNFLKKIKKNEKCGSKQLDLNFVS